MTQYLVKFQDSVCKIYLLYNQTSALTTTASNRRIHWSRMPTSNYLLLIQVSFQHHPPRITISFRDSVHAVEYSRQSGWELDNCEVHQNLSENIISVLVTDQKFILGFTDEQAAQDWQENTVCWKCIEKTAQMSLFWTKMALDGELGVASEGRDREHAPDSRGHRRRWSVNWFG